MPKYLFFFEKGESVRWLGHLDILRAFERAVRRSNLPIAFSLGFNPRVRINFASALSTGITGSAEPAVIELTESLPSEEVQDRLNSVLPPGIIANGCHEIPDFGTRDLLNAYDRAEYEFVCASSIDYTEESAREAAACLLACIEIPIVRERENRTRTVNIRPFISLVEFVSRDPSNGRLTWRAVVGIGESGNVKPADVAGALSVTLPELTFRRAHRVRLLTVEDACALV